MNLPQVFLSYSHADKLVARRLVRRLAAHGIRVWFDDRELRLGSALTPSIRRHIENADVLVVLASQKSADSLWVGKELEFAMEHGKPVVPIFLEDLSTHQRFKEHLGLDAVSLYSFSTVLDTLVRELYQSVEQEPPPADPQIITAFLHELAREEPNLSPLIHGYLDSGGLHYENVDTVLSVDFHALDEALDALFDLFPREDMARCAALGFGKAGAGTRALTRWIKTIGDGGLPLVAAVGHQPLPPEVIPAALALLEQCNPPNNQALYHFIDQNITSFTGAQRRAVIRLVTWPVRPDATRFADVAAAVALRHFPDSLELQQVWIRWINSGVFDGKPNRPGDLAYYLSQAHKESLPGWDRIREALKDHVRGYLRSGNKEKVDLAIDHVQAAAENKTPVLHLLLQEMHGVSGTFEWNKWREQDPETANFMGWFVHAVSDEAVGEQNWLRAWEKAKEMQAFENRRREISRKQREREG